MSSQRLQQLFSRVVGQMASDLSGCSDALQGGADAGALEKARRIAHSLHGAGTMYGYDCVSELGAALEKLINALKSGAIAADRETIGLICACSRALQDVAGPDGKRAEVAAGLCDLAWKCECALHEASTPNPPTSVDLPAPSCET